MISMDILRVETSARPGLRDRCLPFITAAVALALLYLGRDVLIPLVVAIMLSFLLAPLVRALRRLRVGRTPSVLITVLALSVSCLTATGMLGTQILRIAESLPQYRVNIQHKLDVINAAAGGRLTLLCAEATRLLDVHYATDTLSPLTASMHPVQLIGKGLESAWTCVQIVAIVLLVLIFVLLEHESLRDRFIRLAGATDIRLATLALNDAGERLSRFFVSQFTVNLTFGVAIALTLSWLQVPQALLFGALAGVMRFVPYVGVGLAALLSTALAFAVDPGWSLAAGTLTVFILLDGVVGQLLEPHLYGHATGLSPLSVVVAAIFWSALWGPAGLILSTPLTLCLVVAGRHIKALRVLELLLSDVQVLSLPQKFYQRALSGDPHEIIGDARAYLKRNSLATYCDRVLIPALHLAHLDSEAGASSAEQQLRIRRVVVDVVSALSNDLLRLPGRRHAGSVLDDTNAGYWLRQQREQVMGKWQGPIGVPSGSVVICLGLGSSEDDLVAELLARVLLGQKVDGRHFSPHELDAGLPEGANPDGVSIIYLVSAFPNAHRARADALRHRAQVIFPDSLVVTVFCPGITAPANASANPDNSAVVASSLSQAMQLWAAAAQSRAAATHTAMLA